MGSTARLQPYIDQLKTSIHAVQRELRQVDAALLHSLWCIPAYILEADDVGACWQAHEHAVRLSALHSSRLQLQQRLQHQQETIDRLLEQQKLLGKLSLQALLSKIALVALGASAFLLPQVHHMRHWLARSSYRSSPTQDYTDLACNFVDRHIGLCATAL